MTAPRRRSGPDPAARGIVVLVVAVLVGFVLLLKLGGTTHLSTSSTRTTAPPSTTPLSTTPDTTGTTSLGATTTAPGTLHKTAKILVLNATGGTVKNLATKTSAKLTPKGFNAVPGPDPAVAVPTTSVYFTPGYQADAAAVASALSLSPSVVAPLPAGFPSIAQVTSRGGKVVVVLGKDAPTA